MTGPRGTVSITQFAGTDTWLVVLEGEHDAFTVPMLNASTEAVWAQATNVLVDLRAADFIDPSVIGWLLRAGRTLTANGAARIELIEDPGGFASRILDVTGLRHALTDPAPASVPSRASSRTRPAQLRLDSV